MTAPLAKFLRDIRINHGELLLHMAEKLGMGPSELSAIEIGYAAVPEDFYTLVCRKYDLSRKEKFVLWYTIYRHRVIPRIGDDVFRFSDTREDIERGMMESRE